MSRALIRYFSVGISSDVVQKNGVRDFLCGISKSHGIFFYFDFSTMFVSLDFMVQITSGASGSQDIPWVQY